MSGLGVREFGGAEHKIGYSALAGVSLALNSYYSLEILNKSLVMIIDG